MNKPLTKRRYAKQYTGGVGAPAASRGWVVGGTVQQNDLLYEVSELISIVEMSSEVKTEGGTAATTTTTTTTTSTTTTTTTTSGTEEFTQHKFNIYIHLDFSRFLKTSLT